MPYARPLSPHLGIYEWRITMALSVMHRLTGIFLCLGAVLVAWGLIALADNEATWATFTGFCASGIGIALLICWTFSLFLHLCQGIQHLFRDAGRDFDVWRRDDVRAPNYFVMSWLVVVAAIALTLVVWLLVLFAGGVP